MSFTDLELIGYFRIHSRTDRHLFARGHVERLIALVGRTGDLGTVTCDFIAVGRGIADELCDAAERRLSMRLRRDEHGDYELPHRDEES